MSGHGITKILKLNDYSVIGCERIDHLGGVCSDFETMLSATGKTVWIRTDSPNLYQIPNPIAGPNDCLPFPPPIRTL
ncbi:hypothetical protein CEXT_84251 [Caerostris extrusa]|uniref:Uncharacterized protein n=1 Tax=Caerostris extrusa TaxID=172846 RepID=A0AAV4MVA7_CAEEX|nr:hypothetical protein CEXT_84251 [Caerostris extrusa]